MIRNTHQASSTLLIERELRQTANSEHTRSPSRLEMWGGVECTVGRIGDDFRDQLVETGHHDRLSDLDAFAELGIGTIRYPILWERCQPEEHDPPNWDWVDERLGKLREHNIRPIAGLLHHGSGPAHTSLLDPQFPEKLARYAALVADRYPWVDLYTPVNEPGTTGRFSALYGLWYPHHTSDRLFALATINQCKGIVLAMAEIRKRNPDAKLVQTEELGKTRTTPPLRYQANFENERRWLTLDLLCGTLVPGMTMWEWMTKRGIADETLHWFRENPCPPDIIGVNFYPTSERFLDHRVDLYPSEVIRGNGQDTHVDISAVGARSLPPLTTRNLLWDIWSRYELPIAVTEVHLGSDVDNQMRWLHQIWSEAQEARKAGIDMRAVTAWAMVGMVDWHCLLTCNDGHVETGLFEIEDGVLRNTPLADMVAALAKTGEYNHPTLSEPGWWKRPDRFLV